MYDIKAFDESVLEAFYPVEKIGLTATVSPEGLPHITLTSSIRAVSAKKMTIGEFCRGIGKQNLQENPKTAFLVLTGDKKMYRGHARWSRSCNCGPEYDAYSETPLFAEEACFSVNNVHYLDLVDAKGPEFLSFPRKFFSASPAKAPKRKGHFATSRHRINFFSEQLFNKGDALKFMSFIRPDGFPEIVFLPQCRAAGGKYLVFSSFSSKNGVENLRAGKKTAVFCLTRQKENVLVRGSFVGFRRRLLSAAGYVNIDWVYNSMPPAHGQIYPPVGLEPVQRWTDFEQ